MTTQEEQWNPDTAGEASADSMQASSADSFPTTQIDESIGT
jgi:hypothetical protein